MSKHILLVAALLIVMAVVGYISNHYSVNLIVRETTKGAAEAGFANDPRVIMACHSLRMNIDILIPFVLRYDSGMGDGKSYSVMIFGNSIVSFDSLSKRLIY